MRLAQRLSCRLKLIFLQLIYFVFKRKQTSFVTNGIIIIIIIIIEAEIKMTLLYKLLHTGTAHS